MKLTFLAIIPLALCRAQAPATDPQHASLEGRVTSLTGEPLKKVTIRLEQAGAAPGAGVLALGGTSIQFPAALAAQSDAQGNFVFENLDPGRYSLTADRPGYNHEAYSGSGGGLFTLTAGQRMTGIAFTMTPESAISGRVVDADGDPLPRARVTVSRVQYTNRGKQFVPTGSTQTLLDGTFRVEGLTAGRYYLSAQEQQNFPMSAASSKVPAEGSVTTYYPAATQISNATPIVLANGIESRGIDIRLVKTRVFHIRGKVIDVATGGTPNNVMVRISPKDSQELAPVINLPGAVRNGAFDFGPLPPGDYLLQSNPVTSRAPDGTMTTVSLVGRQAVAVGGGDVNDMVFRVGPGAEITGKISTEPGGTPQPVQPAGQAPAPGANLPGANLRPRIQLIPTEAVNMGSSNAESKEDGTFAIHGIAPAVYQVQVFPIPAGMYLKSVRFGNQDITRSALDLTSGGGATLDVLLSPNSAEVSGTLHGSDGSPLAWVSITLWNAGAEQSTFVDPPKTTVTDPNGGFKFTGLAPGDYRVAAWPQNDAGLTMSPEFRSKFESKAAKVKLSENSHETVDAPLIPRDAIASAAAELR